MRFFPTLPHHRRKPASPPAGNPPTKSPTGRRSKTCPTPPPPGDKKVAASQLPVSGSGPLGTEGGPGAAEWKSKLTFYSVVGAVLLTLLSGLWWLAVQMSSTVDSNDPTLTADQLAQQREELARQGKTITGQGDTQMSPSDPAQAGMTPEEKNRRVGDGEGEEPGTVVAGPKQVETSETGKRVGGGADGDFFPGSQASGGGAGAGNKRSREERSALPRWAREPVPVPTKTLIVDPVAKAARVIVPDYQLSLAIGREGQNARLAARLTGWRIDIRSDAAGDPAGQPA